MLSRSTHIRRTTTDPPGPRPASFRLAAWLALAAGTAGGAQEENAVLGYRVETFAAHTELTSAFFWFHPYLTAVPVAGRDGLPAILLVTQKHLTADDHYSNTHMMRSSDLGKTWSAPTPIPALKWLVEDGYDLAVSSIVPNWHSSTRKVLAIGHSNLHDRPSGFVSKRGATWVFYTCYDPETNKWSEWAPVGERGTGAYGTAAGCDQWLIEPDGSCLVPVYVQAEPGGAWHVEVWRCSFNGHKLSITAKGTPVHRPGSRGIHEPSLTRWGGRYWLTIRSDDTALVTTSTDGLSYEPLREWTFDDGRTLGSYNTQQHWATHSDALFLVYTRRGAGNDHIFRHRAPIFMAQVDPAGKTVIRKTERVVLPDRGVPLGNFGVANVTPRETWVSVGENMWPYQGKPPTGQGAEGAVLIARIVWDKPNRLLEQATRRRD